ncbi:fibrobacter succinogenes major paralogous domain-containing protein [Dysgonomonas sp. Marseille-P4677]|uniref:fibrobacter succinogenes major paralogous domain-containing protein n=1 Tax=Dysgonomonas sp. Marseille-P4677 TaxID=2364790 RepID=UPI001913F0F4|nr:fibrobacter succinogenes major paralogous domain-containing protein [Dysgonomonas sp. Marseille-P4677]MBK5720286.1 fibrobacter succinogenes major paralogous domain-containing protein [Dysgonomonas sp. Marseille-P4677]
MERGVILSKFIAGILIFIMLNGSTALFSQITIGSSHEPNVGSLLDLKEHLADSDNTTASRGLLLPRVALKKLEGNLSETLGVIDSYSNIDHTGLIVYNITDPECPLFMSGIYVWDGSSWQILGRENLKDNFSYIENTDGTGVVTDYEGHSYTTKRFMGTLTDGTIYNKVWTTQNLRSLKDKDGQWIECPDGLYFNQGYNNTAGVLGVNVVTEIPNEVIGDYINAGVAISGQSYDDFIDNFGLLYTVDQGTKACPKGWHMPTYNEWKDLLDMMGGTTAALEPIKANAGKVYGYVEGGSYTWGKANNTPNGFNAIPAGYVEVTSRKPLNFGRTAGFHGVGAVVNIHYGGFTYIGFTNSNNASMRYSVRCVMD